MSIDVFDKDYALESLVTVRPQGHNFSMSVTPRFTRQFSDIAYEQFSSRLVANFVKKCDLFVDVGAHYGFYSLVANNSNNRIMIVAIEPIDENFKIMKMNLNSNGISGTSARLIKSAAGSRTGEVDFIKSSASDNCGLYEHPNAPGIDRFKVPIMTIDHILCEDDSKCPFIKVDTEGNELDVLKGMDNTFKKYRELSLLIEMNPKMLKLAGVSCEEITQYLDRKGFKVFGIDDIECTYYPLDIDENCRRMQGTNEYFNIICVRKGIALSIAFFSHSQQLAGAERSLVDLIQDLGEQGVLCSVILPGNGPLRNMLHEVGASVHVLHGIEGGYQWASADDDLFLTNKDKLTKCIASITVQAITFLSRLNADAIYSQTIVIPWGALCAEILELPHAWSICEYGELDHQLKFYFGFKESMKALYDSSDVVFSITQSVKNIVLAGLYESNDKVHVVYRNVQIGASKLSASGPERSSHDSTQEMKIGVFGTIQEGKGQKDIVEAGIQLLRDGHKVKTYLYGYVDQRYLSTLLSLIKNSGFESFFVFGDFLLDPYEAMKEMDVIVSCSRNEALGRNLIEAILLRKPIIYPDSGGPKEVFVDNEHGLAYMPGDHIDLKNKLLSLIQRPEEGAKRAEKALGYISNRFTARNYSRRIERSLRDLKRLRRQSIKSVQSLLIYSVIQRINALEQMASEHEGQIASLKQAVDERDGELDRITSSRSWRIAILLRSMVRILRGLSLSVLTLILMRKK